MIYTDTLINTGLPSSVAALPPDLSNVNKLSDNEVGEPYFDTQDELQDAARKLWNAASWLNQDTRYWRVADIIAPTLEWPPRWQIKTWKKLLISLQESTPEFQSEHTHINGFILPSHSSRRLNSPHQLRQHLPQEHIWPQEPSNIPAAFPMLSTHTPTQLCRNKVSAALRHKFYRGKDMFCRRISVS